MNIVEFIQTKLLNSESVGPQDQRIEKWLKLFQKQWPDIIESTGVFEVCPEWYTGQPIKVSSPAAYWPGEVIPEVPPAFVAEFEARFARNGRHFRADYDPRFDMLYVVFQQDKDR